MSHASKIVMHIIYKIIDRRTNRRNSLALEREEGNEKEILALRLIITMDEENKIDVIRTHQFGKSFSLTM